MALPKKTEDRLILRRRQAHELAKANKHVLNAFSTPTVSFVSMSECKKCDGKVFVKLFPKDGEKPIQGYTILNQQCKGAAS